MRQGKKELNILNEMFFQVKFTVTLVTLVKEVWKGGHFVGAHLLDPGIKHILWRKLFNYQWFNWFSPLNESSRVVMSMAITKSGHCQTFFRSSNHVSFTSLALSEVLYIGPDKMTSVPSVPYWLYQWPKLDICVRKQVLSVKRSSPQCAECS